MNKEEFLSCTQKKWESDFFKRDIRELSFDGPLIPNELDRMLDELDQSGVWGIEVLVTPEQISNVPTLEDAGFRLVDSKMSFISKLSISDVVPKPVPFGRLRQVRKEDLPCVSELTVRHLVDNPVVYSRFKNPDLYSREESIRYYDAWNLRAFREQPELFVVWEVEGEVGAYFNYMRFDHPQFKPYFKGILTVVDPRYRGRNAQNIMQSFLFEKFQEPEWWIDNTTQISNTAVIKNHIKAGKAFHGSELIFFRVSVSPTEYPSETK